MNQISNDLIEAVRIGDLKSVKNLIHQYDISYSKPLANGYDLLLNSTELKHHEITKLLLRNSCKVNGENNEPAQTPLHFAVENSDSEIVDMLLDRGANINAKNESGSTPLLCAVLKGNEEVAELLLTREADLCGNNDGITPLQVAMEKGLSSLVGKLSNVDTETVAISSLNDLTSDMEKRPLKRKSELVSLTSKKKQITTLFDAVANGDLELVKMCRDQGADINEENNNGLTPISYAVSNGHAEITEFLLKKGAKISGNKTGITPLHIAAETGLTKIVETLLKHGADVNSAYNSTSIKMEGCIPLHFALQNGYNDVDSCDKNWKTPLYVALQCGNTEAAKFLINHGANIDAEDLDGRTILNYAVSKGYYLLTKNILKQFHPDINNESNKESLNIALKDCGYDTENAEVVQWLLEYGFTIRPEDVNDSTLVFNVIEMGYTELIEDLLKYGLDLKNEIEHTLPLHIAVENQQIEIVKLFLTHGADVNAKDHAGKTPLVYSTENSDLNMTNLLLLNGAKIKDNFYELLTFAIQRDNIEMVKIILENRIDIDAADEVGRTALHSTALYEMDYYPDINVRVEIARLLLNYGANANAKIKNDGVTTLHLACKHNFKNLVEILLEYKADVECLIEGFKSFPEFESYFGQTPLHIVAGEGYAEIIPILLKGGANINYHYYNGFTPLHLAVEKGNIKVVSELLKHGAIINAKDIDGNTPLHISYDVNEDMVNILIEGGANINCRNLRGYTPLHAAAESKNVKVLSALLKHGAFVDAKDDYGITALHISCQQCGYENIELLLKLGSDVNIMTKDDKTLIDLLPLQHYSSDDSDDIRSMRIIKLHLIKLKAANFYINEKILHFTDLDDDYTLSTYAADCADEIRRLKHEKMAKKLSFYDILTKNINSLAKYAKHEDIIKYFDSNNDLKLNFPIYADMIEQNFKKAFPRRILLDQSHDFFECYFKLPYHCVDEIKSYLSDADLNIITDLWNQLSTSS